MSKQNNILKDFAFFFLVFAVYFLAVVPFAFLSKIMRRDVLRLERPMANSYWTESSGVDEDFHSQK